MWGEGLADPRDDVDNVINGDSPHGEHLTDVESDVDDLNFEPDKLYEFELEWKPELWGDELYMQVNDHHARMEYSFGDYKCENYMNMFVGLGRTVEEWSHDKRDGGQGWGLARVAEKCIGVRGQNNFREEKSHRRSC